MNQFSEFIESGILELYVMGITSAEETTEVERMLELYPEIRQEIDRIEAGLEEYAMAQAVQPKRSVKMNLMATVDLIERMQNGEEYSVPPMLTPESKAADFAEWLNRPDMVMPADYDGMYAKIIGVSLKATTAVIWFSEMVDNEVHDKELESFLILEGTCDFTIGNEVHSLKPGDFLTIPLHTPHIANVTSKYSVQSHCATRSSLNFICFIKQKACIKQAFCFIDH